MVKREEEQEEEEEKGVKKGDEVKKVEIIIQSNDKNNKSYATKAFNQSTGISHINHEHQN